eukprot:4660172-Amphidinium_carterae.1
MRARHRSFTEQHLSQGTCHCRTNQPVDISYMRAYTSTRLSVGQASHLGALNSNPQSCCNLRRMTCKFGTGHPSAWIVAPDSEA